MPFDLVDGMLREVLVHLDDDETAHGFREGLSQIRQRPRRGHDDEARHLLAAAQFRHHGRYVVHKGPLGLGMPVGLVDRAPAPARHGGDHGRPR